MYHFQGRIEQSYFPMMWRLGNIPESDYGPSSEGTINWGGPVGPYVYLPIIDICYSALLLVMPISSGSRILS